jgi:uncharacterized membrane protein required for colicin V production
MEYILDIIFIALAVAMIILGAKKGLVKALLDGLSTIISGVIAYILSTPVAKNLLALIFTISLYLSIINSKALLSPA